ncbi:MAG: glycosyltransferase [Bacteroidota bacterium]
MKRSPQICIIVPVFNEAKRLRVESYQDFLENNSYCHFIFVDDASQDSSFTFLQRLKEKFPKQVLIFKNPINLGKANTIYQGLILAQTWAPFAIVGYWDADLSTPLEEIPLLLTSILEKPQCILVMGSRRNTHENQIHPRFWRHIIGRGFATISSLLFSLPYYDTQCGAKLLHAPHAYSICHKPFISRWLVDIEIILRLQVSFPQGVIREIPVSSWVYQMGSSLKFLDIGKIINELRKVYIYYKYKK